MILMITNNKFKYLCIKCMDRTVFNMEQLSTFLPCLPHHIYSLTYICREFCKEFCHLFSFKQTCVRTALFYEKNPQLLPLIGSRDEQIRRKMLECFFILFTVRFFQWCNCHNEKHVM